MNSRSKKMVSFLMAAVVMTAAICVYNSDNEDTDDSDAAIGALGGFLIGVAVGAAIGAVAGYSSGYSAGYADATSDNENTTRSNEASTISEETAIAIAFYVNALENYNQLWGFTSEHFIRNAELAASYNWSANSTYDSETVLVNSGTYYNSAYMMENATAQMNIYLDSLSERMQDWTNYSVYDGNMTMNWTYGNVSLGSTDDWGGAVVSATNITSTTYDKVYIAGGTIYVFGGSATITSSDGDVISLPVGETDLDSLSGFEAGVYTLQSSRQYAGSEIIPVVGDAAAADVTAGIVMEYDDNLKLGYYEEDRIVIDGISYSDLQINCVPTAGGSSASYSVMDMLGAYNDLIGAIYSVLWDASSSALAVWNIFDEMGSACTYLTTLTVPNDYENVEMSTIQKQVMTSLTLTELAQYYDSNSGSLKTSGYNVTTESLSLFCRGDVYYYSGTEKIMLYDDVIFTPYYYTDDQTLTIGTNQQTQFSICTIWADGQNLSGWNQTTDSITDITSVYSGYYYDVSEIYYDNVSVSSVALNVEQIDYIDPQAISTDPIDPLPSESSDFNWWAVLLIIIGALIAAYGVGTGNDIVMKVGALIVIIGIGWIVIGFIFDYIDSWSLFSIPLLSGGS